MRPRSRPCCRAGPQWLAAALLGSLVGLAWSQPVGFSAASIEPVREVHVTKPGLLKVTVNVSVRRGYHVNSNQPNDPYLIPTTLSWNEGPFPVEAIEYPEPEEAQFDFSDKPMSVYSSRFGIVTTVRAERVPQKPSEMLGSLRFQACDDQTCLPPKTIPVRVPVRP